MFTWIPIYNELAEKLLTSPRSVSALSSDRAEKIFQLPKAIRAMLAK
jgi:hypothetical protein